MKTPKSSQLLKLGRIPREREGLGGNSQLLLSPIEKGPSSPELEEASLGERPQKCQIDLCNLRVKGTHVPFLDRQVEGPFSQHGQAISKVLHTSPSFCHHIRCNQEAG